MMLHCAAMAFKNSKGVDICVSAPVDGEFEERVRGLGGFFVCAEEGEK